MKELSYLFNYAAYRLEYRDNTFMELWNHAIGIKDIYCDWYKLNKNVDYKILKG